MELILCKGLLVTKPLAEVNKDIRTSCNKNKVKKGPNKHEEDVFCQPEGVRFRKTRLRQVSPGNT